MDCMSKTKQITVGIDGMTCSACSARIEKVLNKLDGVKANVNLAMEQATVQYDEDEQTMEAITNRIEKLGYEVRTKKINLDIEGMTCAACSNRIEKVISK